MVFEIYVIVYTEATQQVSAVASHINEHIRQQDNFKRMVAIQKSFDASGGLRILVPGRSFVKEGQLNKVCTFGCFVQLPSWCHYCLVAAGYTQ